MRPGRPISTTELAVRRIRDDALGLLRWRKPPRRRLLQMLREHDLRFVRWFTVKSSAAAARVVTDDGETGVLKLERRRGATARELEALRALGPSGRVPTGREVTVGALLVEYLEGRQLDARDLNRGDRCHEVARALRDLHGCPPRTHRSLRQDVDRHHDVLVRGHRVSSAAKRLAADALVVARSRATRTCLLHGDPHPGNVLVGPSGHVWFVDPYGLIGAPEYDIGFLAVYAHDPSATLEKFLQVDDSVDPHAARAWLQWCAVYRLDNAIRNGLALQSQLLQVVKSIGVTA